MHSFQMILSNLIVLIACLFNLFPNTAPPPSNPTAVIVGSFFGALFLFIMLLALIIVCVICLGRRFSGGSPPKSEPDRE